MKKIYLQTISLLLIFIMLFSCGLDALAATYIKGANKVSASYKATRFYKNFSDVILTGDNRTDVLAIALSQLGYHEGEKENDFDGSVGAMKNYTEFNYNMGNFGIGYGSDSYPWCASFVSFCLLQSGCTDLDSMNDWCRYHEKDKKYIWREVSCSKWAKQLRDTGYFKNSVAYKGSYVPISGDLIFFSENKKSESHVGFVLYTDASKVYTIEGNAKLNPEDEDSSGVYIKSYDLSDELIRGYGVLPYKTDYSVKGIDYSGNRVSAGYFVANVDKKVYETLDGTQEIAVIEQYTMFEVTEVAENGRLKIDCEINGKNVEGYIENNEERVYQLYDSENKAKYLSVTRIPEYKSYKATAYYVNGVVVPEKTVKLAAEAGDKIGIKGKMFFTKVVKKVGYYFDDNRSDIVWCKGGFNAETGSFSINAALDNDISGVHTLHYLVQLENGRIAYLDSLSFDVRGVLSLKISSLPTLRKYLQGNEFAFDGLEVIANYTDGTSGVVANYVLSGYTLSAGTQKVTVEYKGVKTYFNMYVSALPVPKVKVENTADGIEIKWNTIKGATNYFIYRREFLNGKWTKWQRIKNTKLLTYKDLTASTGKYYSYTVCSVNKTEKSKFVSVDYVCRLISPKATYENTAKGVKVKWKKVSGAKGYYVYRRGYSNGKWGAWERIGTATTTQYEDAKAKSGVQYRYTVRAFNGKNTSTYISGTTIMYLKMPPVAVSKITGGARVTWVKSAGAKEYYVYRREYSGGKWGKWKRIAKTTKGYNDKSAKKGKQYQYTVKAINGKYESSYVASVTFKR